MDSGVTPVFTAAPTPAPAQVVCTMRDLAFEVRGQRFLDVALLQVHDAERLLVLGPNGAGKSLLLRLGHELITGAGRVEWASTALRDAQAMVFQQPTLLRRSSLENVAYPLRVRGVEREMARERAQRALAQMGVAALASRPARALSGGEKQRVALARAIALAPRLLWLDEPTASLDPGATRAIEDGVRELNRLGCTIVMTTHDVGQARRLATRVLFMHRGRIVADQGAAAFFDAPSNEVARRFLAGELIE